MSFQEVSIVHVSKECNNIGVGVERSRGNLLREHESRSKRDPFFSRWWWLVVGGWWLVVGGIL